jgi:hypothetical protein
MVLALVFLSAPRVSRKPTAGEPPAREESDDRELVGSGVTAFGALARAYRREEGGDLP